MKGQAVKGQLSVGVDIARVIPGKGTLRFCGLATQGIKGQDRPPKAPGGAEHV